MPSDRFDETAHNVLKFCGTVTFSEEQRVADALRKAAADAVRECLRAVEWEFSGDETTGFLVSEESSARAAIESEVARVLSVLGGKL